MNSTSHLMNDHALSRIAVLLFVAALIAGMAACPSGPGPGPDYLEVTDWSGLNAIRDNLGGNYRLMNDLNSTTAGYETWAGSTADTGKGWKPIGSSGARFTGTFDGNGYLVEDLHINRPGESDVGLFGYVGEGGIVKNIGVDAVVVGGQNVGALVGSNWRGTVRSDITQELVYSTKSSGSVTGEDSVGGLVGYVWQGTVTVSWSSAAVSSAGPRRAGGLVGHNSMGGVISDSEYKGGAVAGQYQVGGLVGLNAGEVRSCKGTGTVTGVSGIGGVAGVNLRWGGLNGSHFDGTVNGGEGSQGLISPDQGDSTHPLSTDAAADGAYIGGLVGWNEGDIDGSSSDSTIAGQQYVGGLVGWNDFEGELSDEYNSAVASLLGYEYIGSLADETRAGSIRNSHAGGSVTGSDYVGGLVGWNEGIVDGCYATGSVIGSQYVGGLTGWSDDSRGAVSRSFWDTASTGIAARDTDWGIGGTTSDMRNIDTYRALGWDICAVASDEVNTACTWNIAPGGYPFLSGKQPMRYSLTISSSTGGSVITPGEGTFTYEAGAVVRLATKAETCYRFVSWTGDVSTIADVNGAATSLTMPARDVSVIASFEGECTPPPIPQITFAVTGPMTYTEGMDHWAGAEMARDEINAARGVNVGGVRHDIALEKVETDEFLDLSGVSGTTALAAVIDDVDFVVGGFRTASVMVYREVAMDAGKIMMNCGAAPKTLQMSVVTDYERYKYWLKVSPYNDVFLVRSCLRYTGAVNSVLRATLAVARNTYGIAKPGGGNWMVADVESLRFAVLMVDEEAFDPMEAPVVEALISMGLQHVGTVKCESTASDLSTQLMAISAADPHIVFTILRGPPGNAYGTQQNTYLPRVFSLGINVEAQNVEYHDNTGGSYHMTLDTWADGVATTPTAVSWFNSFVTMTGRYPSYTATTYDAIKALTEAVEAVSAANGWSNIGDVIAPENIGKLIQHLETHPHLGVGAHTAYYPMPEVDLGGGTYALSLDQVLDLYPHVQDLIGNGVYTYSPAHWTTSGGYVAHDTVYGPGYQTGIGVQWQEIAGTWKKVAVWPMVFTDTETPYWQLYASGQVDLHGNWNFQYPGTEPLKAPDAWIAAWLTPP